MSVHPFRDNLPSYISVRFLTMYFNFVYNRLMPFCLLLRSLEEYKGVIRGSHSVLSSNKVGMNYMAWLRVRPAFSSKENAQRTCFLISAGMLVCIPLIFVVYIEVVMTSPQVILRMEMSKLLPAFFEVRIANQLCIKLLDT